MSSAQLERYLVALQNGERQLCRETIDEALNSVSDPMEVYQTILWPAMERIERLYRSHRICLATEHMATRINRALADQLQLKLIRKSPRHQKVVISCADGEPEELSAQICADLFEADGWQVFLIGGGVPADEITTLLGRVRPDLYLMVGTQPQGVPGARAMIDLIRELDAHPMMNIMVTGGVFNRTAGLWREIHADLCASTVLEALTIANQAGPRTPALRTIEPMKRRQRRRPLKADGTGTIKTFTLPSPAMPVTSSGDNKENRGKEAEALCVEAAAR